MLTCGDLKRLAATSGPCLTIFQPVRPRASTLAGCLDEAAAILARNGMSPAVAADVLRPLHRFEAGRDWQGRAGSVVMFRAPGFSIVQLWPEVVLPLIVFGDEFFVLPLLAGIFAHRDFWLLTLSAKAVRLFRGSPAGLVERALPKSLARGIPAGTHTEVRDFLVSVDRGVHPTLTQREDCEGGLPLILAGYPGHIAAYRGVNTYPKVLSGAVHGVPEALGPVSLHGQAMTLMSSFSSATVARTSEQMQNADGLGLLATRPDWILEAATGGRVEQMLISPAASQRLGQSEIINRAALAVIRGGGHIGILEGSRAPDGVAAILRQPEVRKV